MKTNIHKSIIHPKTKEIVTAESERMVLVDTLKEIALKIKELEQLESTLNEWLAPYIDEALANGEKTLGAFTIVQGAMRFSADLFKEAPEHVQQLRDSLKNQISVIEEQFKAPSKSYLKFKQII